MKSLRAALARFVGVFRRRRHEAEMNEELRAHLDALVDRNLASGMSPAEAHYAAQRTFGGVAQIAERARDERRSVWAEQVYQDVRYAVRQSRQAPGFAAVIVLSLALGIGANTAVFSVLNEVLLKPLPVRNPQELIVLEWRPGSRGMVTHAEHWSGEVTTDSSGQITASTAFTLPAFDSMRAAAQPVAELAGVGALGGGGYFFVNGVAEEGGWLLVSGNYHAALGVEAALGRTLVPTDDRPEAEAVAVLSHAYWQRRFNGDRGVIGNAVMIHNLSVTIVGVTAPGFFGTDLGWSPDFTLPLSTLGKLQASIPAQVYRRAAEVEWLQIIGRLKPGVSREQAASLLEPAFQREARGRVKVRDFAEAAQPEDLPRLAARSGAQGFSGIRKASTPTLLILAALVAAVLAIACLNVANLLLARGAARKRELAVRFAMGAGRARIVRQLLTESGLLAALGGAAGVLVAVWGKESLMWLQPFGQWGEIPAPAIDGRALAFTLGLTVMTTVLFGLAPALHVARTDLNADFKGATPGLHGRSRVALRLGRGLMVAQVALSLVVLIGAMLFVRTLHNLRHADVGFDRDHLVMFGLRAKPRRYTIPELTKVVQRIEEKLAAIPGVRAATFGRLPIGGLNVSPIFVPGATADGKQKHEAAHNAVAPSHFTTLDIPLILGRSFTPRDAEGAPKVAVINQSLARELFGDAHPIGRRFGWTQETAGELEIVGVVRDARLAAPREPTRPMFYVPFLQRGSSWVNFNVRVIDNVATLLPLVRQAVREIDPEIVIVNLRTSEMHMNQFLFRERMFARISSFFGVLVLTLVCIGLYGLMSYAVLRRTGEIGLRMALGALPRWVLWMILRESLMLVGLGVILGIGGAFAATRLIQSLLYDLSATDPLSYVAVALILVGVAFMACTVPARRAAKVDPIIALRAE